MENNNLLKFFLGAFLFLLLLGTVYYFIQTGDKVGRNKNAVVVPSSVPVWKPMITGTVVELSERSDSGEKLIVLSVDEFRGKKEYKFSLVRGVTEGMESVSGGQTVGVSFDGSLSEKDYVVAKRVEVAKKQ